MRGVLFSAHRQRMVMNGARPGVKQTLGFSGGGERGEREKERS